MVNWHELDELLVVDPDCEAVIPVPRSGKHWDLYQAEVYGYHGCLDAPVGD